MLIFSRRKVRMAWLLRFPTSSPEIVSDPAVAGSRPLTMRMRVDLPDPDRPMTTNISPDSTLKEASITAAVVPSSRSWSRVARLRRRSTARLGFRPNTWYLFYSCITGEIKFWLRWQLATDDLVDLA